jgi:hypothetical protein
VAREPIDNSSSPSGDDGAIAVWGIEVVEEALRTGASSLFTGFPLTQELFSRFELILAANEKKLIAAFQLFAGIGIYDTAAMAFDTDNARPSLGPQLQLGNHLSGGFAAVLDFDRFEPCPA